MIFSRPTIALSGLIAALFVLASPLVASAASYGLAADKETFVIGDTFNVDVKLESADVGINAVQATITYPKDIVEVTGLNKANSAFDFWIQGPDYSNDSGQVSFIGGSQSGISGKTLEVLRITFKVKGAGPVGIIFSDGAVTASDGSGTNVLSAMKGLQLSSITKSDAALIKAPQIVREATPPSGLPARPSITVPLYPDPTKWNDVATMFFVSWKLPTDVTGVAMALDNTPGSAPSVSEGLFETKKFPPLSDGVYYLHARFQNDIGWGPTLHYRIAVDTLPPPSFKVVIDNPVSENPAPKVTFNAGDALSGISRAVLAVDNKEILQAVGTTSVRLPPVLPGAHTLKVKVFDRAGNSAESSVKFEITAIPTPLIEFLSKSVSLEEPIFALGKSTPGVFIDAHALDAEGREVFKRTVESDSSGNWQVNMDQSFRTGSYTFVATARDKRGASSIPSQETFRVRTQTVLSLGGFVDLGWFEIFLFVLLLVIAGGSLAAWLYVSENKTREAYRIIVGRDVEKLSALLNDHLKELEEARALSDNLRATKEAELIGRLKETVAKMRKYLGEEVGKLK